MATSSRKRNHCTLLKLSLSLLLLFCLFFFTRRVLDPKISLHGDFVSLTPVPLFPPPRSAEFVEKFDESTKHVSSVSGSVENVDANVTSPEFQEENNEEPSESVQDAEKTTTVRLDDATKPVSSVSDSVENVDANVTSPEFQEENNGESSKSVENAEKAVSSSDSESEENLGEITDRPMSSNEETDVPISSKSDLDDKTRENMQVENVPSEETEVGVDDDVKMDEKWQNCDLYQGKWVKDEGYPLYEPGSCPYVDEAFDCQNNGRPDSEYLKWRWKPDECDLPRFNATDFLVRLRGKKLLLVGDSMNRNQFESLLCLLREGLTDKSKMYEVHGYKITKGRGYFIFKFEDYDCTVEFVRSHFLVREGVRVNAQGNSNPTLSIDRIDKTARRWQRADILVFNTGHWWTHGKTARGKNYYKEGNFLYPRFDAVEAYRRAIRTWANWVKRHLSKDKLVFYRGYSSAHFRGGDWDSGGSCNGETEPVKSGPILDSYPQKMTIVEDILKETKVPVVLLNVTHLTNYRKDGHPSVYGKNVTAGKKVSTRRQDCSHWCVPGVPDAWNELIYATLVARQN